MFVKRTFLMKSMTKKMVLSMFCGADVAIKNNIHDELS